MGKGIIRYRPHGWDDLVNGLVEDCIKEGEVEIDETNRPQVEGFIRHCIGVGADAVIDKIRDSGVDAVVRNHKILIVLSQIALPGRPQYKDPGIGFPHDSDYSGPGKVSFIPADRSLAK